MYDTEIQQVAFNFRLPIDLLKSQVVQESSGNADAFRFEPAYYSKYVRGNVKAKAKHYGPLAACSYGLLQIMLETAVEVGFTGRPEELFTPSVGLWWGATYMSSLWDRLDRKTGEYHVALAAYNGGPALLHVPWDQMPSGPVAYSNSVYHRVSIQGGLAV